MYTRVFVQVYMVLCVLLYDASIHTLYAGIYSMAQPGSYGEGGCVYTVCMLVCQCVCVCVDVFVENGKSVQNQ